MRHMAPPANALQAEYVSLKSVSNEGHFTLEAETVFRPYVASRFGEVIKNLHLALPAHPL
jgi:hypothetical protein